MASRKVKLGEMSTATEEPLVTVTVEDLMPLPPPGEKKETDPPIPPLSENQRKNYESSLDGVSALMLPRPKNKEEEEKLVARFLSGLNKLLSRDDNGLFWQPLMQTLAGCVRCQTCSEACPIYVSSGKQEIYRPTYRTELVRRLINKYVRKRGRILC